MAFCHSCSGLGWLTCSQCGGRGKVAGYGLDISGNPIMNDCGCSAGKIRCGSCNGAGSLPEQTSGQTSYQGQSRSPSHAPTPNDALSRCKAVWLRERGPIKYLCETEQNLIPCAQRILQLETMNFYLTLPLRGRNDWTGCINRAIREARSALTNLHEGRSLSSTEQQTLGNACFGLFVSVEECLQLRRDPGPLW